MIDQRIFEDLQTKIDEETTVRDVSRPASAPATGLFADFFRAKPEAVAHNIQETHACGKGTARDRPDTGQER